MFSRKIFTKNLSTEKFGSTIHYIAVTDSTNDEAWKFVEENRFTEGTVVVTDKQSLGRGRQNRKWFATPNLHLPFSIIFTPEIPSEKLGLLSLLAGVSIAEGLQKITNVKFTLKWPNDILYNNRKIGGVLIETRKVYNKLLAVIGIGINVNELLDDFPVEIRDTTTSLKIINNTEYSREQILVSIIGEIESNYYFELDNIFNKWVELCGHINQPTKIYLWDKTITGNFMGINNLGHARLKINNTEKIFSAGELIL